MYIRHNDHDAILIPPIILNKSKYIPLYPTNWNNYIHSLTTSIKSLASMCALLVFTIVHDASFSLEIIQIVVIVILNVFNKYCR